MMIRMMDECKAQAFRDAVEGDEATPAGANEFFFANRA